MSNNEQAGTANAVGTRAATKDASQAIRELADKGTGQAKAAYEKVSAAANDTSGAIQSAHSTAVQGAVEYNTKVVEYARVNTNAAFEFATKLLTVKTPSEFLEMTAEHTRKQIEILTGQGKELTSLGQKVMLDASKPLKDSAARVFQAPGR